MAHNLPSGRRRDSRLRATAELSRELRLDANDRQLSLFSLVSSPSCRMVLVGGRLVGGRRTIACCDLKCGNCRSCLRGRSWSPARDCEMRRTAESGTGRRIAVRSQRAVNARCACNARSDGGRGRIVFRRVTGEVWSRCKCVTQHHNKRGLKYSECDWSAATERLRIL